MPRGDAAGAATMASLAFDDAGVGTLEETTTVFDRFLRRRTAGVVLTSRGDAAAAT